MAFYPIALLFIPSAGDAMLKHQERGFSVKILAFVFGLDTCCMLYASSNIPNYSLLLVLVIVGDRTGNRMRSSLR